MQLLPGRERIKRNTPVRTLERAESRTLIIGNVLGLKPGGVCETHHWFQIVLIEIDLWWRCIEPRAEIATRNALQAITCGHLTAPEHSPPLVWESTPSCLAQNGRRGARGEGRGARWQPPVTKELEEVRQDGNSSKKYEYIGKFKKTRKFGYWNVITTLSNIRVEYTHPPVSLTNGFLIE